MVGGGLPVGAYAGKRAIMEMVAPAGPMYQAGTLSGNPLAMAAGLATIRTLLEPGVFESIAPRTERLCSGLADAAAEAGVPLQVGSAGTMFGFYFLKETARRITDYATAKLHADTPRYGRVFHAMLEEGFYFAPSQFEAAFLSSAHTDADVERTVAAFAAGAAEGGVGGASRRIAQLRQRSPARLLAGTSFRSEVSGTGAAQSLTNPA